MNIIGPLQRILRFRKPPLLVLIMIVGTTISNFSLAQQGGSAGSISTVLLDIILAQDSDHDGLDDDWEALLNTDPHNPDTDGDGIDDGDEIELGTNPLSTDSDNDGLFDGYEVTAGYDPIDADMDNDGVADGIDACILDPNNDADGDGICALDDNCPAIANAAQTNTDFDDLGNACDSTPFDANVVDADGDGIDDQIDNCPGWPNPNQIDVLSDGSPGDGIGDACQCGDFDNNGEINSADVIEFDALSANGIALMPISALEKCDVNGDGLCTILDRTKLNDWVANGITDGVRFSCPTVSQIAGRALNRVAFGKDEWTSARIASFQIVGGGTSNGYAGIESFINEQINPQGIVDAPMVEKLAPYRDDNLAPEPPAVFPTIGWTIHALRYSYCQASGTCIEPIDNRYRPVANQREIKFLRNTYSRYQLDAVLQDFWFNHFSVNSSSGIQIWALPQYESVIADNMYGDFANLVQAVAFEPAMLNYLNQQNSTRTSMNENFARELMELHTVGPADTYTHDDIGEATKILTGHHYSTSTFQYYFDPNQHTTGITKSINLENTDTWYFGVDGDPSPPVGATNAQCNGESASQGATEARVLICKLAKHPKSAELIGSKLIARFLGDTAYNLAVNGQLTSLTDQINTTWANSSANLTSVLSTLLMSEDFKKSLYYEDSKAKRPSVFSSSLVRGIGSSAQVGLSNIIEQTYNSDRARLSFNTIMGDLEDTGENFYHAGPPTGYDELSGSWLGGFVYSRRFDQINRIIDTSTVYLHPVLSQNYTSDEELINALAADLLPGGLISLEQHQYIADYILSLPPETSEAEKKRLAMLAVLSTPQFLAQ